jgi:hypothetical protein
MSARLLRCILFAAFALITVPIQADWLCDFLHSIPQDTKRRNCWPKPFLCQDRQSTRAPFAIQVANGWKKQNLLSDRYFEAKTGELTESARLKIHWITFDAPSQHRSIYVGTAATPEETSARMSAVQAYVAQIVTQGEFPQIAEIRATEEGWPADQVERVILNNREYQKTPGIYIPPFPGGIIGSNTLKSTSQ